MIEPKIFVVVIFSILGSYRTLGRTRHFNFVEKGKITAPYCSVMKCKAFYLLLLYMPSENSGRDIVF